MGPIKTSEHFTKEFKEHQLRFQVFKANWLVRVFQIYFKRNLKGRRRPQLLGLSHVQRRDTTMGTTK